MHQIIKLSDTGCRISEKNVIPNIGYPIGQLSGQISDIFRIAIPLSLTTNSPKFLKKNKKGKQGENSDNN